MYPTSLLDRLSFAAWMGRLTWLGALQPIGAGFINAAFVRGKAPTWLSATHRRTTVKADSKVLSGIDLRDALNPVEDQSYYFTAARCGVDLERIQQLCW